jgi:hypothetical protein
MNMGKTESEAPSSSVSSKAHTSSPSSYTNHNITQYWYPHDDSEISDKAQSHAIYLSRRQELKLLVILHVLEHIHRILARF